MNLRKGLGVVLVLFGAGLFLYPNFKDLNMNNTSKDVITQIVKEQDKVLETVDDTDSLYISNSDDKTVKKVNDVVKDYIQNEHVSGSQHTVDESVIKNKVQEVLKKVVTEEDIKRLKETVKPELYKSFERYNKDLVKNGQHIKDAFSYESAPVDLSLNDNSALIGTISVPDMKVNEMPLYLGASMDNLSKGAAIMSESSMPIGGKNTNTVVSGHRGYRGSAYFQYIENLKPGSLAYVSTPWETLVYKVREVKITNPDDVDSVFIQEDRDMLTLVSCHPYVIGGGPERYIVYCDRVEPSDVGLIPIRDESIGTVFLQDKELSKKLIEDEGYIKSFRKFFKDKISIVFKEDETVAKRVNPETGVVDDTSYTTVVNVISGTTFKVEHTLRFLLPIVVIICLIIYFFHRRNKDKQSDSFV